jgi:LysR family transcriptional regulator, nitrogen assimilation regulatory protein
MQLQQLRYFLAVVEHGGFSRAADALGRTQQALSKGIQTLEESLGVKLLDRGTRIARPTIFGQLLLEPARTIDREVRVVTERLGEALGEASGHVRVGASPTAAGLLLGEALVTLRQRLPALGIEVITGLQPQLLPRLLQGELDLCVGVETREAEHQGVIREVLGHEHYRVIAAADHPLATHRAPSHVQLGLWPWLRGTNLGVVEEAFRQGFEALGLRPPEPVLETDSLELVRSLLVSGGHLCLLPEALVARELELGRLVTLGGEELTWSRPISLYYRADSPPGPPGLTLARALHEAAENRAGRQLPRRS